MLGLLACAPAPSDDDMGDGEDSDITELDPWAGHPMLQDGRFYNVAHRGGSGLGPEETMLAFDASYALGVDVFEIDVQSTSDGVLVLMHDTTVDRTTGALGAVNDFTWDEISAMDAAYFYTKDDGATYPLRGTGVTVTRLDELFTAYPDMLYMIESKQDSPSITQEIIDAVDAAGLRGEVALASFTDAEVLQFRDLAPDILTTLTLVEGLDWYAGASGWEPPVPLFSAPLEYGPITVTADDLTRAHDQGMTVWVWTINESEVMEEVVAMGADGIITDYPDRLNEVSP